MLQVVQDNVSVHRFFLQLQVQNGDGHLAKQYDVEFLVVRRRAGFCTENSVTLRRQFWEQAHRSARQNHYVQAYYTSVGNLVSNVYEKYINYYSAMYNIHPNR